jgi:hypothetical protein
VDQRLAEVAAARINDNLRGSSSKLQLSIGLAWFFIEASVEHWPNPKDKAKTSSSEWHINSCPIEKEFDNVEIRSAPTNLVQHPWPLTLGGISVNGRCAGGAS